MTKRQVFKKSPSVSRVFGYLAYSKFLVRSAVSLAILFQLLPSIALGGQKLSLLSYNVWALYPIVGGKAPWRYEEIGKRLDRYDIVALQEAWDPKTDVIEAVAQFPYVAGMEHAHGLIGSNGLLTLSKLPILEEETFSYHWCVGPDCFVKKSALRTRIQLKSGEQIDVYNTHMNAWMKIGVDLGAAVRKSQIMELASFIAERSEGLRVILMGDTNSPEDGTNYADMRKYWNMVDALRVVFPDRGEFPALSYSRENPWTPRLPEFLFKSMRIDYVWLGGFSPGDVEDAGLTLTEAVKDGKPLSDHYGLAVSLTVP